MSFPLPAGKFARCVSLALTMALSSGPGAAFYPANAQGAVKGTFGDWQIRCETPLGSQKENCALVQSVTSEDQPNVGLTVIFLRTADGKARLMRVLAPLGVLLPAGLRVRLDENDSGPVGFVRCLPDGCVAEVEVDDDLQTRLKAGKQLVFVIYVTPEMGIGIPVSLNGFGPGFDSLK